MKFFIEWVLSSLVWFLLAYLFHYSILGWIVGFIVSFLFKEFFAPILVSIILTTIRHNSIKKQNNFIPNSFLFQHKSPDSRKQAEDSFLKGVSAFNNKEYKFAIYCFTRAINMNNKEFKYFLYRGNCYFFVKDYINAKNNFNMVIRLNPGHSDAYLYRGICWFNLHQNEFGEQDFLTATKLGNNEAKVLLDSYLHK